MTALLIALIALLLIGALAILVPVLSGTPWVPTNERRTRRALEMAGLKTGEIFYDLGSGDGRIVIAAAREYNVRAIGIEISPVHCLIASLRARFAGVGDRVTIRWGNLFRADLSDADAVFFYGRSRFADRLQRQIAAQLPPGARLVTAVVEMPGWQPEAFDMDHLLFLYRMPATAGSLDSYLLNAAVGPNPSSHPTD
jgi:SAM-dependent methyltransferase